MKSFTSINDSYNDSIFDKLSIDLLLSIHMPLIVKTEELKVGRHIKKLSWHDISSIGTMLNSTHQSIVVIYNFLDKLQLFD